MKTLNQKIEAGLVPAFVQRMEIPIKDSEKDYHPSSAGQ